ncbi:WhiB family transcriptional regulator [Acidiferrimicrobium sp. IK]|uniref:WhiB family transcriptional regulator n=1 Tax=Acidiferrimicrobium sp. IK TaxID=2871700 RepID=UPI002916211F|nr:WhiB family transcriptional regulator [Acidiferrimicrobium sp. IK]MCU4185132.1 WhiB family transcriptional regulator [Acidiferrimicrobium sp. IK]
MTPVRPDPALNTVPLSDLDATQRSFGQLRVLRSGLFDRSRSWTESAVCRHVDTELFFPVGSNKAATDQANTAKAICAACPVRAACLEYALATNQTDGIWGGLDEAERLAIRRRARHGQRMPFQGI